MSIFLVFLTQISDRRILKVPRGASGRFSEIFGVGDTGKLKCRMNPVKTGLVHAANVDFSRVQMSDRRLLIAPGVGGARFFPRIFGVVDAGKLKYRVNPVQTGLVYLVHVGFFRVSDPDLRSAPIDSS